MKKTWFVMLMLACLIFTTAVVTVAEDVENTSGIEEILQDFYTLDERSLYKICDREGREITDSFYQDTVCFYEENNWDSIREYVYDRVSVISYDAIDGKNDASRAGGIRHEAKQTVLVECKKVYTGQINYLFATISGYYYTDSSTGLISSVDEESVRVSWDYPYWGDLYDPPVLRSIDSYATLSANHLVATFGVRFSVYGRDVEDGNFFGNHNAFFQVTANNRPETR